MIQDSHPLCFPRDSEIGCICGQTNNTLPGYEPMERYQVLYKDGSVTYATFNQVIPTVQSRPGPLVQFTE